MVLGGSSKACTSQFRSCRSGVGEHFSAGGDRLGEATFVLEVDGVGVCWWRIGKVLIGFVVNFFSFVGGEGAVYAQVNDLLFLGRVSRLIYSVALMGGLYFNVCFGSFTLEVIYPIF